MRIWRYFAAALLLFAVLLTACAGSGTSVNPRVGKAAADFSAISINGTLVNLSDYKGKPVFVNFWAIRCPPCRDEMPYIQQIYDEYSAKGLVVLGVNNEESLGNVKPFVESGGFNYPIMLDQDDTVANKYGVYYLPASFFIDKNGVIRAATISPFTSKGDIEKYLKEIM